ncbi:hypothetical protein [Chitinophaga sp.]|uniref:PglD-related sugar-binding protein n=1 Tax=Chitinophaga sp. TaxID=1869181 RepID=UPI0031E45842
MRAYQLYGTGGHAKVLAELAAMTQWTLSAAFSDNTGGLFNGIEVTSYKEGMLPVLIAIGHNATRKLVAERVNNKEIVLVHPTAVCSPSVYIGEGTVILSGAIVQANVKIGKQCILNIGSKVDHDAVVGDYVHLGPGCYIGGGATVGEGVLIGPGAVVMRNVQVPAWTEIPPNTVFEKAP